MERASVTGLIDYLRRWWKYLSRDLRPWWTPIAGILTAGGAAAVLPPDPEARAHFAGVLLQLGGILAVAWGLHKARELFDRPSLWQEFLNVLRRLPRWTPEPQVVYGKAAVVGLASLSGDLRGTAGTGASLKRRVEVLEAKVDQLFERARKIERDLEQVATDRERALRSEAEERAQEDERTRRQLEEAAVGGISLELTGVLWLLLGTLLSAFPEAFAFAFTV